MQSWTLYIKKEKKIIITDETMSQRLNSSSTKKALSKTTIFFWTKELSWKIKRLIAAEARLERYVVKLNK